MVTHPSILLIEDSPGECELFRLALAQTGFTVTLYTEQDSEDAFHFLESQWMAPAVVPLRASNEACSSGLSCLSGLSGWSDGKFFRKNQIDQKDQPTKQTTARVARAQDHAGVVHSLPSASTETMPVASHSSVSLPEGGLNRSPTARIEEAHSDRAASASTGDRSGLPSLILLDLNLRGQDGCDFLKRLRSDPRFATIPTIIFTTSDDQHDLARCYSCGANGYVVKPGTFAELVQCTGDICRYWIDRNRVISMIETPC
jgi:CheY-like chemotaxis protein